MQNENATGYWALFVRIFFFYSEKEKHFYLTNEIRGSTLANEITRNECDDFHTQHLSFTLFLGSVDSSVWLQKESKCEQKSVIVRIPHVLYTLRNDMLRYKFFSTRDIIRVLVVQRFPFFFSSFFFFFGPERPQKSELKRTTQYARLAFTSRWDKFYRGTKNFRRRKFKKSVFAMPGCLFPLCIFRPAFLENDRKRYVTSMIILINVTSLRVDLRSIWGETLDIVIIFDIGISLYAYKLYYNLHSYRVVRIYCISE